MTIILPLLLALAQSPSQTPGPPPAGPPPAAPSIFMFETGTSLLQKCETKSPEYALACTAYVVGVVDGIKKDIFLGRAADNCWPDRMGAPQVRDIVVKYLKAFPDQRGFPASLIVSVSLNDAFPCHK
jgi:hypothetical protein